MAIRKVAFDRTVTALLLVASAVVVNVIASRHLGARADLTEGKENTLSAGTLRAIERLPDRARVRAFFTKDLPPEATPVLQPVVDLVGQIERASNGKVAVDRLDPTKFDVVSEARKLGIAPFELQLNRSDNMVQAQIYLGLEIRCADRPPRVIPFVDPRNPEYEIARAFAALAGEKTVAFLTREPPAPPKFPGIDMPIPPERRFEGLRERLRKLYRVVDLANTNYGDPVPADVDVLVLGRPAALSERERYEIDQFLMRGGRILALVDRFEVDLAGGAGSCKPIETGLDPLLEKWGVRIPSDVLVVDGTCEIVAVPKKTPLGTVREQVKYPYFPSISRLSGGLSSNHPITKVLQGATLFWASPLDLVPEKPASIAIENLLQSSELSYRTREVENLGFDAQLGKRISDKIASKEAARQRVAVALLGKFPSLFAGKGAPAPAESRPSHLPKPAVADADRSTASESKETRLVIVGDSDFATNAFLGMNQSSAVLLENMVEWLALEQDLTSIRGRGQVRRIRNLEVEAMRGKNKEGDKPLQATTVAELQNELTKMFEEEERVTLEARESADRERFRIKLANVLGPGAALLIVGLARLWRRARERERYAALARAGS